LTRWHDGVLEVVKKALEERADVDEYCVYERDVRGYIVPRPSADALARLRGADSTVSCFGAFDEMRNVSAEPIPISLIKIYTVET